MDEHITHMLTALRSLVAAVRHIGEVAPATQPVIAMAKYANDACDRAEESMRKPTDPGEPIVDAGGRRIP